MQNQTCTWGSKAGYFSGWNSRCMDVNHGQPNALIFFSRFTPLLQPYLPSWRTPWSACALSSRPARSLCNQELTQRYLLAHLLASVGKGWKNDTPRILLSVRLFSARIWLVQLRTASFGSIGFWNMVDTLPARRPTKPFSWGMKAMPANNQAAYRCPCSLT